MWEVMSGVPGGGEGVLELVVDVRRVAQRADGRGEDDVEVAPVRPEPDRRDVSPAVHHVGRTSVRYPASLLGSVDDQAEAFDPHDGAADLDRASVHVDGVPGERECFTDPQAGGRHDVDEGE